MPDDQRVLIDTETLESRLDDPRVRMLEPTVYLDPPVEGPGYDIRSGREDWEASHIPGSVFVDLLGDFSDPDAAAPFMMPSPEQFARAMEAAGVGDETFVVLYDRAGSMWAARLWWMLRAFGHDDAAVLDGGWTKWTQEGRPVTAEKPASPAATFTPRPRPELIAGKDEVLEAIEAGGTCLVNSLSPEDFEGTSGRYPRPGRIPTSVNVPSASLLDPQTGAFRAKADLREQFAPVIESGRDRIVTYCGGGIAATADALALTLLGFDDVAVYDGSLMEWTSDPDLPLETGPATR